MDKQTLDILEKIVEGSAMYTNEGRLIDVAKCLRIIRELKDNHEHKQQMCEVNKKLREVSEILNNMTSEDFKRTL